MERYLDQLKQAGAKIRDLWAGSSLNKKLIFAGAIILIVIAASVLFIGNKQVPYEVMYTELSEKDAAAIVAKLDEYKTPYKLDNNGTTILVSPADKYTTRLKLAGANLPMGVAGLELFQTNNFGETQTDKKVKYQMAMQGELARTIQSLEKVKAARVHLVIPEKTLFSDKEELPSAAVAITTKDATSLTPQEVQGIINLIANSVEGLDPKKVVIVDNNGNLISENLPQNGTTTETLVSQMAMKKEIETEKQLAIQSMLDQVLGQNNSVVRVSAELNFDNKEQTSETYAHDPNGSFTRSEHVIKEAGTGTTTNNTAAVPGTDTNIPQYTQVNPNTGISTTDKSDITRNYEINKTESVTKYSTGETKYDYLTVAVLVNNAGTAQSNLGDTEDAKITKIRNIVATACGLKENRPNESVSLKDNISVAFIDFYSETVPEPPPASAIQKILSSPLTPFAFALAALLIMVLVWLLIRRKRRPELEEQERETGLGFETVVDEEISIADLLAKNLSPEEREKQKIRQEIEKLIDESPESAAQVLKTWLIEEQR